MDKAIVFLRTSLFSFGGPEAHVPPGTLVIECTILESPSGGLTIRTERFRDERGRELIEAKIRLQLPWAKIDHVQLLEG